MMARYISPDEFISYTKGHAYDMDGSYGVQCVDGIKKFAYDVYGEYKFDCGNGWAYGLWTYYGSNGVEQYFNKHPFSEARKGDWIIWNWGSDSCPQSHVAMYVDMKTSNLVNSYGQSQDGIKAFNTAPLYTDGILGVLRPKIYEDDDFFPYKGYYEYGDSGVNVAKINDWYAEQVKGDFFGIYTMNCTEALQTKGKEDGIYNDEIDGKFGPHTLETAKHYGFKE